MLWNHGGSSDEIFERGYRWTVGIASLASRYLVAVLELLCSIEPALQKIALFAAKTGFASQVAAGALRWIEAAGLESSAFRVYETGLDDFAPLLAAIEADPPDVLLGVGRFADDVRLARLLAESKPPIKAVALVGAAVGEFGSVLGRAADGVFAPSQWELAARHPVDCGPSGREFAAKWASAAHPPLDYPGAQGYAAGLIATRCVEEAASLEQSSLREAAGRLRCITFYGPFGIDPLSGRQIAHSLLVTQWQHGTKKLVWPPALAETQPRYPAPPGRVVERFGP